MILSDEQYAVVAAKDAEIESLKRICDEYQRDGTYREGLVATLRAEVERLRAGFQTVLNAHEYPMLSAHGPCDCDICEHCRAALAHPAATGEGEP